MAGQGPARGFVLVDPLDGTREFLAGRDEYTVNIALVRDGVPAVGVVAAPALGLIWRGATDHGAERLSFFAGGIRRPRTAPRSTPARGRRMSGSRRSAEPTSTQ